MNKHGLKPLIYSSIVVLLIFSMIFVLTAKAQKENMWAMMAPMKQPRAHFGLEVVNNKIYAIGGENGRVLGDVQHPGLGIGSSVLASNEEYDPTINIWTTKAPMPTARTGFATATINNKIYCIGGYTGYLGYQTVGTNEVYNPVTDTWETKTPMPIHSFKVTANAVDGKIFVIYSGINEVYDPSTDSWSSKTPPPYYITGYGTAEVDGKIYYIGSDKDANGVYTGSVLLIYDIYSDSWTIGSNCPVFGWEDGIGASSGFFAPRGIYIFGEYKTHIYDIDKDIWLEGSTSNEYRRVPKVAVIDDVLYVVGGMAGEFGMPAWFDPSPVIEQYTPFLLNTIPDVVVVSPKNIIYAQTSIPLEFLVNETTSWTGYCLDGQTNVTLTENTNLTGLAEGSHSLEVFARDMVGDEGVTTITFTVDTLPPVITVLSPENKTYGDSSILLDVEFDEQVLDMKYSLDGLENKTFTESISLAEVEIGDHNVTVYATDLAGHTGISETIYFSIEPFPTTIVLTSIAIITVVGVVIFTYFKKYKKN